MSYEDYKTRKQYTWQHHAKLFRALGNMERWLKEHDKWNEQNRVVFKSITKTKYENKLETI